MKRWLYVLIPLLALGGLIGWRLKVKRAEAAAQTKMREARTKAPPVVAVVPAVVRDIVHTFEGIGSVEAPFNVNIAPKVTGRIDFLMVREGDHVKRGQVLVRIDPSELQAQVNQQQAAVAEAQQRLAQARITQAPTDVSVTTQIRQQQAALESAQADYNQVRQNYVSQVAAAQAAVTDAQGKVNAAAAAVANTQAAIRSAQANLDNARAKYNRTNDLYKQGFVAAQDVDDAKTAVSVQQAALDVARGQLDSANAQLDSAKAQLASAQQQAEIVKTTGKADIEASRAKEVQAQAALDYAKANTAQKPAYQANLAALRSSVAAAQAMLRNAQAQLANTVLTAPLDGFVTARNMDPGAMATPGQPILAVQAIRQVWVTVPVPEEVSRKIYLGMQATVTFDALPGRAFTGKVTQINPSADPLSRQFVVRVTLDNTHNLLKPGMFAHVVMVTDRIHGLVVVPREAVQQGKDGPSVMVVDAENTAHRRPVTTGASDAAGIAVLDGVQSGEKVITLSAMPVRDGQTVRPGGGKPGRNRG
jgi:HlyD family secretion protein